MKNKTKYLITAAVLVASLAALGTAVVAQDRGHGYGRFGGMYQSGMGMGPGMGSRIGHGMGSGMGHGMGQYGGGYGQRYQMMENKFALHDLNKDGSITEQEMLATRAERLKKYDQNNDGKLTLKEFEGLWMDTRRERMVDHFQAIDNDGDAVVTTEEFMSPMRGMILRHDRNDDGKVTLNEMRVHHPMRGYGMHPYIDDDKDKDKD